MRPPAVVPLLSLVLGACAPVALLPVAVESPPPDHDVLYAPAQVSPGRLEYAPDRSTFAPILTERAPYPTQVQANDAYRRLLLSNAPVESPAAASVWLFGCKPGVLDPQTARIVRVRGNGVHCATDFLDVSGRSLSRETVNFAYTGRAWVMRPAYPPRTPAPWLDREASPEDPLSWLPWRDRYE